MPAPKKCAEREEKKWGDREVRLVSMEAGGVGRSMRHKSSQSSATESRLPRVYFRHARTAPATLLSLDGCQRPGPGTQAGSSYLGALLSEERIETSLSFDDGFVRAFSVTGPQVDEAPVPPGSSLVVREHEHGIHEIALMNRGTYPVLLESGFLFRGGSQDRALTEAHVFSPGAHVAGVYCVEQGRWQAGQVDFESGGTLPDLLAFRLRAAQEGSDIFARQRILWHTIQESLLGMGALGETLSVNAWRGAVGSPGGPSHTNARRTDPGGSLSATDYLRGGVMLDSRLGLASFALYPGPAFRTRLAERLTEEWQWRRLFAARVLTAREYFRIYDERSRLALRCTESGKALRDLEGKYLLFHYSDEDLEGSFIPPLESPPDLLEGPLPEVDQFASADEFLTAAAECHLEEERVAGSVRSFRVHHPTRPILGEALLREGRLISLELQALRAA